MSSLPYFSEFSASQSQNREQRRSQSSVYGKEINSTTSFTLPQLAHVKQQAPSSESLQQRRVSGRLSPSVARQLGLSFPQEAALHSRMPADRLAPMERKVVVLSLVQKEEGQTPPSGKCQPHLQQRRALGSIGTPHAEAAAPCGTKMKPLPLPKTAERRSARRSPTPPVPPLHPVLLSTAATTPPSVVNDSAPPDIVWANTAGQPHKEVQQDPPPRSHQRGKGSPKNARQAGKESIMQRVSSAVAKRYSEEATPRSSFDDSSSLSSEGTHSITDNSSFSEMVTSTTGSSSSCSSSGSYMSDSDPPNVFRTHEPDGRWFNRRTVSPSPSPVQYEREM